MLAFGGGVAFITASRSVQSLYRACGLLPPPVLNMAVVRLRDVNGVDAGALGIRIQIDGGAPYVLDVELVARMQQGIVFGRIPSSRELRESVE